MIPQEDKKGRLLHLNKIHFGIKRYVWTLSDTTFGGLLFFPHA